MVATAMDADDMQQGSSFGNLPEEILELIFSYLSPYGDFKRAMLVCKLWHRILSDLIAKLRRNFCQMLRLHQMNWSYIQSDGGPSITDRYSHCACYFQQSMYIFGGCTSTNTTFNDLWRFDLATRQWVRPLAMGTYPSPKACASMVVYKDSLVLFGGWSHPTPVPLHQAPRYFSELHMYTPATNRWSQVMAFSNASLHRVAGHSASVVGDLMVVFGGSQDPGTGCNEVQVFDFLELVWKQPPITGKKPKPRYGQSQVTLDRRHILILGGCGGPNQIFSDLWLLHVSENEEWWWEEILVLNPEWAPPQLWCHPACMVDGSLVVLSKNSKAKGSSNSPTDAQPIILQGNRVWVPPQADPGQLPGPPLYNGVGHHPPVHHAPLMSAFQRNGARNGGNVSFGVRGAAVPLAAGGGAENDNLRAVDQARNINAEERGAAQRNDQQVPGPSREVNGNQQHGHHSSSDSDSDRNPDQEVGAHAPRPGFPSVRPNAMHNRQRQLDMLRKHENRLRSRSVGGNSSTNRVHQMRPLDHGPRNPMLIHVLDVSQVLTSQTAAWLPVQDLPSQGAPEETIFYSLIEGRGELVLFGGVQRDPNSMQRINSPPSAQSHIVSNGLYIITPTWLKRL